jgi:calcineurin-like phosphoesterase family protein
MWRYFLNQLPGNKILVQGNHDKDGNIPTEKFVDIYSGFVNMEIKDSEVKSGSQRLTLCHYPMISWYQSHKGAWQLFGHMHNSSIRSPKEHGEEVKDFIKEESNYGSKLRYDQIDVGVDGSNFMPLSYSEIKKIILNRVSHLNGDRVS